MSDVRSKRALRLLSVLLCVAWSGCPDVGVVGENASEQGGAGAPADAGGAAGSSEDDEDDDENEDDDEVAEDELCIIGLAPCAPCDGGTACPDGLTCLGSLCRQCLDDEGCGMDGHCELGACESEESESE